MEEVHRWQCGSFQLFAVPWCMPFIISLSRRDLPVSIQCWAESLCRLDCCLVGRLFVELFGTQRRIGRNHYYDHEGIIQWAIHSCGRCCGSDRNYFPLLSVASSGVQAMKSIPIIIGGSVMLGNIVLGAAALHEELSLR